MCAAVRCLCPPWPGLGCRPGSSSTATPRVTLPTPHHPSLHAATNRTPTPLPFLRYWSSAEHELRCTTSAISPTTPSSFLRCTAAERLHCMAVVSKSEHATAAYHDYRLSSPPCRACSTSRRERRSRPSTGGSSPRQAFAPSQAVRRKRVVALPFTGSTSSPEDPWARRILTFPHPRVNSAAGLRNSLPHPFGHSVFCCSASHAVVHHGYHPVVDSTARVTSTPSPSMPNRGDVPWSSCRTKIRT
jgi:hypothetical protein